jgi:hypothetical protein
MAHSIVLAQFGVYKNQETNARGGTTTCAVTQTVPALTPKGEEMPVAIGVHTWCLDIWVSMSAFLTSLQLLFFFMRLPEPSGKSN